MRIPKGFYLGILGLALSLLLAGCGPSFVRPGGGPNQRVALVLGGGGARGFAHIGVLRELEAAKVPVDMIIGVSVGSLIGALYADQPDSFQLEWKAFKIEKNEIFDFKLINVMDSLASGEAIKTYIDKNISAKNLEDLKLPLVVVACDLRTGKRFIFQRGPIRDAVRASASIPGVFPPVVYQDKLLVDGGVVGNLAPQVARDLGADLVIGVSLSKARDPFKGPTPGALTVILESIDIMGEEIVELNRNKFDVLITPQVGMIDVTDFSQKRELIDAGRKAALLAIPEIKKRLGIN